MAYQRRRVALLDDVPLLDARVPRLLRRAHGRVPLRGVAQAAALALRLEVRELGGGGGLLGLVGARLRLRAEGRAR